MKILRRLKRFFHQKKVYRAVSKSVYFDKDWYVKQYPDVQCCGYDPVKHYLKKGWKEGKMPSERFHSSMNLCISPDVWKGGISPLEYYLFCKKRNGYMNYCVAPFVTEKKVKSNCKPLVSVIVASYNYARFLSETIESILKQTYTNYEIIIVDDGSTDNSIEVIKYYLSKNENIRFYMHSNNENKGLPCTIKLGVEMSHGDYIAFCESDDVWHSQYLEKKIGIINSYRDVKIISNNVELFGNKEFVQSRGSYVSDVHSFLFDGVNEVDISNNYIPTFSAVMIKREVLQSLDYNTPILAWIDFWLYRQILNKSYLYYTNEKLTFWRMHDSYNGIINSKKHISQRDLFMFKSDELIGIKISRQILKRKKIIESSILFDKFYYLKQYGDCLGDLDPVIHYLFVGWKNGYNPSIHFNNDAYLSNYTDVWYSNMNPLIHYELYGKKEGRKIFPVNLIEKLQIQESDIEFIHSNNGNIKTVLLISHELSLTGAPRALLNMTIILRKLGVMPVILSLRHGDMEKEIIDLGLKVLVEPFLYIKCDRGDNLLYRFFSGFNIVIFNTLDTVRFVEYFAGVNAKKICWLHEGSYSYDYWRESLNLPALFSFFDEIYAVGSYSKSFAAPFIQDKQKLRILLYGIPDIRKKIFENRTDCKIRLLLPGSLSVRKGQLVLLQALQLLSKDMCEQIMIYIVGGTLEEKVEKAIKCCHSSCLNYLGELEHEQLLRLFSDMDVILTPSLDDPMPIVCTEAMILEKAIIVSENTGTASFIENGINGFKIPADDPTALAEAIKKVIENKHELPKLGMEARKIYDNNFTMDIFEKNIRMLIGEND